MPAAKKTTATRKTVKKPTVPVEKTYLTIKYPYMSLQVSSGRSMKELHRDNNRLIRYVRNMDTIYVDEQISKGYKPEIPAIEFEEGVLVTKDSRLQDYLEARKAFGVVYRLQDLQAEAEEYNTQEEDIIHIKSAIIKEFANYEDNKVNIKSTIAYIMSDGNLNKFSNPEQEKKFLLEEAGNNPDRYILNGKVTMFNNTLYQTVYKVLLCLNNGTMKEVAGQIYFRESNKPLTEAPLGMSRKDRLDDFANFLHTEEGVTTLKKIDSLITL